jgi:hypothetical protein
MARSRLAAGNWLDTSSSRGAAKSSVPYRGTFLPVRHSSYSVHAIYQPPFTFVAVLVALFKAANATVRLFQNNKISK